jgi:hypothetical protein
MSSFMEVSAQPNKASCRMGTKGPQPWLLLFRLSDLCRHTYGSGWTR